jgi:hypothetical protein
MPEEYPLLFIGNAEEDIIMTLIAAYEKCGLEEKAASLVAALSGPEFETFRNSKDHSLNLRSPL